MKNKRWICPLVVMAVVAALWLTGVAPKQIAKLSGTHYVEKHFPEMELACVGIDYADAFGDYLIAFSDKDGNPYSCVIGPSFFPISLGQGLFAIESHYAETYP